MPIIPVLLLLTACAPVEWPDPPGDSDVWTALFLTALSVFIPVVLVLILSHATAKSLYEFPAYHRRFMRRYALLRRIIGWTHLALGILAVVWAWGWFVQTQFRIERRGETILMPLAELLVPLPYLISVALTWLLAYDALNAHHFAVASPAVAGPFWTRGGYFLYRLRRFAFLVLMPVIAFAAYQSLLRFEPVLVKSNAFQMAIGACGIALFLVLPRAAIPALGLVRLAPGPVRDHLDATARRLDFRCGGLFVWPTYGTSGNAMVLGVLPRLRYVMFTDLLLEKFDDEELEAVMGHEVGHFQHGHMIYYAAFFFLSLLVVLAAFTGLLIHTGHFIDGESPAAWLTLVPLLFFGIYLFVVFGWLSRWCERQADLAGVQAVASGRAENDGHPLAAGVNAMTRALEKVAALNDMDTGREQPGRYFIKLRSYFRDWQHGSIATRVDFLQRLIFEPELLGTTHRRVRAIRIGLIVFLVLSLLALGQWLGWGTLAKML